MCDAGKTRMIGLPYGEKNVTICKAVFIWYRNVTDGQTDGQTDMLYQHCASVRRRAIKTIQTATGVYTSTTLHQCQYKLDGARTVQTSIRQGV